MSPSTHAKEEGSQDPAPVSAGGTYTIRDISVGCKIYAKRWNTDASEPEERLAEILSIRDKVNNPYLRRQQSSATPSTSGTPAPDPFPPNPELDKFEFFVHWDQFNKRLDEWIAGSRLVLYRDLEWPRQKKDKKDKEKVGKKHGSAPPGNKRQGKMPRSSKEHALLRRATLNNAVGIGKGWGTPRGVSASPSPAASPSPTPSGSLKRKGPYGEAQEEEEEDEDAIGEPDGDIEMADPDGDADADGEADPDADADADADADGDADPDVDADADPDADADGEADAEGELDPTPNSPINPPPPLSTFSKEAEIEKLRTSGSMTQSVSEIARVKNLNRLSIGRHEVDAWYFSPYPQEYAHLPVLYICEFCLAYFPSHFMLTRHRKRCTLLSPPGNEIYRHEDISFFEIDGRKQLTYCRNLSLLSKCFLDHKTLYYDVTPFMYYVMCQRDTAGCHLVGYFSKEKESAENYNVACILTLPQHQRSGFGRLVIDFSYLLSQREGKLGSPEKPLSDLGLLGYRSYWRDKIVETVLAAGEEISVDEIAQATSITHADVMNTCTTLQLFKHYKGQHIICLPDAVLERYEKSRAKRRRRLFKEYLNWRPPSFTRDQLRFGW
ncbi:acyl-CoA N-acyltransferase [Lactarius akahatsu]|uniref:histone acetyltransferase n=1 Tax=Lactarius akahatsu TaxID=416441 RepID=A0AAD4QFT5_9AGAM|nr:acyl-CoA N-acyltransferase [Lactarius akahatsu]